MVRMLRVVLVLMVVLLVAENADARWRVFGRRSRSSSSSSTSVRYSGGPTDVAVTKVNILARRGYGGHIGGGYGGANAEGWGSGSTANAALGRCCFTGKRRLAGSAVARANSGVWFAIKLFW